MVRKIRPSRREFLATGAATTAGLLLGHHQNSLAATADSDGDTVTGIPTGFRRIDLLTAGLHPRELVLLASRRSVGKTSLALNITDFVAVEAYIPTLYVSLGTSRHDITQRLLCARSEVPHAAMRHRTLSPDIGIRLTQAGAQLSKAPLYLDDHPLRTLTEIGETLERVNDRLAPGLTVGLLVVDHLQRVEAEYTGHTESEHLIDVAYGLREMAIQKNLAVLGLMQLSCLSPAGQQARPAVAELRGTQHAADVVMLLHRPEPSLTPSVPQKAPPENEAELSVIRRTDRLADTVELAWNSQYTRFSDLAVRP